MDDNIQPEISSDSPAIKNKVLVCGSRKIKDKDISKIRERLAKLSKDTIILSGAAKGVDSLAESIAQVLELEVIQFPADWRLYGKLAGIKRNLDMLNAGPSQIIAFWNGKSKGTKHCLENAMRMNIPVEIIMIGE